MNIHSLFAHMPLMILGVLVPIMLSGLLWYRMYSDFPTTHALECSNESQEHCIEEKDRNQVFHRESLVSISEMNEEWYPLYAGGMSYDSDTYVSPNSSIVVATESSGEWYGAIHRFESDDWSSSDIRFFIRTENWETLSTALILIETGAPEDDSYFTFNLRNFFSAPASDEWLEVVVPKSAFEASSGNPSWREVRGIGIRVASHPDTTASVWFDAFSRFSSANEGVVSITFDDGYADTLVAAKLMAAYGFVGTQYIIPSHLGGVGFLTEDDVLAIHTMGWDTGGHGYTDLREIGYEAARDELATVKNYLLEREFRGSDLYSYPNGSYDHAFRQLAGEYFIAARTIDGFAQPQGYIKLSAINAVTVSNTTPLSEIFEHIDRAEAEGSWLILTWHKLPETTPLDDIEYARADFVQVLEYLHEKNRKVEPVSNVLKNFMNSSS